jgi:hypothetical protein
MIYLIITTCIQNKFGSINPELRQKQYLSAISETLQYLPSEIIPIIVENNGKRPTYLDNFYHNNNPVIIIYTDNNTFPYTNKGIIELLDIKYVIKQMNMNDNDMIIKLTGRYHVTSSFFFNQILQNELVENETRYNSFFKFYNVCTNEFNAYDGVLGLYAMRSIYIQLLNHLFLQKYASAEIAFAKFIRLNIINFKEMEKLDLECIFAENNVIVHV